MYGVSEVRAELNEGHQLQSCYRWQQAVAKFMNMIEELNIEKLGRFMDFLDNSLKTFYFYFLKRHQRDSLTSLVWGFIIKTIWTLLAMMAGAVQALHGCCCCCLRSQAHPQENTSLD